MTVASYALEVMWDGVNWVDETSRMVSCGWTRGRDKASQLTGRAIAGSLSATLDNPSGRFASKNAAGPLYGNLVPGRKVRMRTSSPVAATLWQGFLDVVQPDPGARVKRPLAVLKAGGAMKQLDKDAATAVATNILTGAAIANLLDDAGWDAAARVIDTGQITMSRWKSDGQKVLVGIREVEETEFGFFLESKDGKLKYEDVAHRLAAPHTVSQATFSDANGAALPYDTIEQLDPWREIFNRFIADVVLFTVQASATLWSLAGEVPTINPGQTRVFYARYPTPDAPTQADHVDAWTTTAATTDMLANAASDGSGTNLTGLITIAVVKSANAMKISLTNTGTIVAYITLLQARGTPAYKNDPIRLITEDATSQTAYGKRPFPLPGKFYPTTAKAQSYTEYGLSRYKDPPTSIRIGYQANASAAHMTQALSRDISDRITVVANGTLASQAQLGFSRDFFIEAEEHFVDLEGHWVRYVLSDASLDAGYWAIGISTLGETTKLFV